MFTKLYNQHIQLKNWKIINNVYTINTRQSICFFATRIQLFNGGGAAAVTKAKARDIWKSPLSISIERPQKGDPYFRELWRKFQLRVHPDLFAKWPPLQKANSEALQTLQGILNEAKSGERNTTEYMRPRTESVEFFLRTDKDDAFVRVPLTIRIPGANSRNVLGVAFSALFKAAGLPSRFHWGDDYWEQTITLVKDEHDE